MVKADAMGIPRVYFGDMAASVAATVVGILLRAAGAAGAVSGTVLVHRVAVAVAVADLRTVEEQEVPVLPAPMPHIFQVAALLLLRVLVATY